MNYVLVKVKNYLSMIGWAKILIIMVRWSLHLCTHEFFGAVTCYVYKKIPFTEQMSFFSQHKCGTIARKYFTAVNQNTFNISLTTSDKVRISKDITYLFLIILFNDVHTLNLALSSTSIWKKKISWKFYIFFSNRFLQNYKNLYFP